MEIGDEWGRCPKRFEKIGSSLSPEKLKKPTFPKIDLI